MTRIAVLCLAAFALGVVAAASRNRRSAGTFQLAFPFSRHW